MNAILAAALVSSVGPYQAGGVPSSPDSAAKNVRMLIHSVKFALTNDGVDAKSLTLLKSDSDQTIGFTIVVPRMQLGESADAGEPYFDVQATWDNNPISLTPVPNSDQRSAGSPLQAKVVFTARATHALRMTYHFMPGTLGLDGKQRRISYGIAGADSWSGPIEKFDVAFTYGQRQVFGLPEMKPGWDWQVGQTGAFIRRENFSPEGKAAVEVTYYRGGF